MGQVKPSQIIAITGEGKGKTTTALGLAVQIAAMGKKVRVIQFLKGGGYTGELKSSRYFGDNLSIYQFGYGCPIAADIKSGQKVCTKCGVCFRENRNPEHNYAGLALQRAFELAIDSTISLLILDEISHAIRRGLIAEEEVMQLVVNRSPAMTIVLTGRNMPENLMALADSATFCHAVKHPMKAGIDARRGIEY